MEKDEDGLYTFELSDVCGERDGGDMQGVPVPGRDENDDPDSKKPDETASAARLKYEVHDKDRMEHLQKLYTSVLQMNRGPVQGSFIMQARRYADKDIDEAQHIPFSCYWPSYEAMTGSQRRWYFHWRGRVREAVYPDTDLSYIFLYIYELINYIGVADFYDGFNKLISLWAYYRVKYPSLDRYLAPWIQDYIRIYAPFGVTTDNVLSLITDPGIQILFPDHRLDSYISDPDAEIPLDLISMLSNYKFHMSRMFIADSGSMMLGMLPKAIAAVNAVSAETGGKNIIARFRPEHIPKRARLPFQNAIYCGKVREVWEEKFDYMNCAPLRTFITSVVKYLENKLREKTGFKGRLKGFELEGWASEAIDRMLADEAKNEKLLSARKTAVKVEIDSAKILQLIIDSDLIRQRLLEGTGEGEGTDLLDRVGSIAPGPDEIPPADTEAAVCPSASPAPDESGIDRLISALNPQECGILIYIVSNGFRTADACLKKNFPGVFTDVAIDNINVTALDTLGDIIIVDEDGMWTVGDDYREDLLSSERLNAYAGEGGTDG